MEVALMVSASGNQPALHREKAYELLADGEWHDYYQVRAQVMAVVHPAVGYRHVEKRRKHPVTDPEVREQMVRTGQRDIARNTLGRKERFEQRKLPDGTRQIRLLPMRERTPEERTESSRRGWKNVSAAERTERGKKSWESRRKGQQ